MLKQTVTYENFNGDMSTKTLYFNFSKAEVADNLNLIARFEDLGRMFEGPERNLTVEEINKLLALVKDVMRLSYGVKSDDGELFMKGESQWNDFTQSAAYDAFLMSLFEQDFKANEFLMGVFPRDLVAQGVAQYEAIQQKASNGTHDVTTELRTLSEDNEEPVYIREKRKPTNAELQGMSREELVAAMKYAQDQK